MALAELTPTVEEDLQHIVQRIVEAYAPDKIILFGSYAYGAPRADSDFDLLIIKTGAEPRHQGWRAVRESLQSLTLKKVVEPFVLTPAELEQRLRYGDQFYQKIVREGRTLYDRDAQTKADINALIEGIQPMKPEESPISSEWYQTAAQDWGAAKVLFANGDELLMPTGVQLQQALEKYLKGYLLSKGWQLVRTHDLSALLESLQAYEPDFAEFHDTCEVITKYYLENRYTAKPKYPLTRESLEKLFVQAEALIARIQSRATVPPPPAPQA